MSVGSCHCVAVVSSEGLAGLEYVGAVPLKQGTKDPNDGWLWHGRRLDGGHEVQVCGVGTLSEAAVVLQSRPLLQGHGGSRNFYIINDSPTHKQVMGVVGLDQDCIAVGIGGRYLDLFWSRYKEGCDGIYIYGIYQTDGGNFEACRRWFLMGGRDNSKCEGPAEFDGKRHSKCEGPAEFDGQNTLIYYNGYFCLFTRAIVGERGDYKSVQVAMSKDLNRFTGFRIVSFPSIPASANIHYAHPYRFGDMLLLLMPIAFEYPCEGCSGIYLARGRMWAGDNLEFEAPMLIFRSESFVGRTVDVNIAGAFLEDAGKIVLALHRFVAIRMPRDIRRVRPPEGLELWEFCLQEHLMRPLQRPDRGRENDGSVLDQAYRRRRKKLGELNLGENVFLSHWCVQNIWKEWQNDVVASQERDQAVKVRRPHGFFGSFIHKKVGQFGGELLIRVIIITGMEQQEICDVIAEDACVRGMRTADRGYHHDGVYACSVNRILQRLCEIRIMRRLYEFFEERRGNWNWNDKGELRRSDE